MKKSFLILLLPLLLAGCGEKEAEENNSNPQPTPTPQPQPESEPQPEPGPGQGPEPTGVKVAKLVTSGDSYKAKFTNGTQFGGVHSENTTKLVSFLNEQTSDGDLISSLECMSLNSLDDLNKDGYRYLTVGSSKANGSLVINTKYGVTNVKIESMKYNNTYTGGDGGYNCDTEAQLLLDGNSSEVDETKDPKFKPLEVSYLDPVNSFTISSSGGRVFIESITITYYA